MLSGDAPEALTAEEMIAQRGGRPLNAPPVDPLDAAWALIASVVCTLMGAGLIATERLGQHNLALLVLGILCVWVGLAGTRPRV